MNYNGGVKDFGTFSEGSCLEIKTIRPSVYFQMSSENPEPPVGRKEIWLICLNDNTQKTKLINFIIKLKLKKQHSVGAFLFAKAKKNPVILNNPLLGDDFNDPNKGPDDGYYVKMQEWIGCNKKCGGGLQFRHLQCNEPRRQGKPCPNLPKEFIERSCNTHPSPSVKDLSLLLSTNNDYNKIYEAKIEKPIIRMMAISYRPQRYDKCYLKDSDALMVRPDLNDNEKPTRTPVR